MSPEAATKRVQEDLNVDLEIKDEKMTLHKLAIELNRELIVMQGKIASICQKLASLEQ